MKQNFKCGVAFLGDGVSGKAEINGGDCFNMSLS